MTNPTYEQLLDFYYDFLAHQQEQEQEEQDIIELLKALLQGYHLLEDNIVELRDTINKQCIQFQRAGLTKYCKLPFYDLHSDIGEDFTHYRAYQRYAAYLDESNRLDISKDTGSNVE